MKTIFSNTIYWVIILLFALVLSGCVSGRERLRTVPTSEQPQVQQSSSNTAPPTTFPTMEAPTSAAIENAPETVEDPSTDSANDTQAEDLLDLINTLDAANQAGDPLDDLP